MSRFDVKFLRPGDPDSFARFRPYLAHFLPVFPRFLRVFTVSPRRNELQAGIQGQGTVARAPKHRFSGLANSGCWERMAGKRGTPRWSSRPPSRCCKKGSQSSSTTLGVPIRTRLTRAWRARWHHSSSLRGIFMSTWGVLPAVFRPLRAVFPGLGAGVLNLAGKTEGTAKKRGKNGEKWERNGLKRVG